MSYIHYEMRNKLSNTGGSPLESMGKVISTRCPYVCTLPKFRKADSAISTL